MNKKGFWRILGLVLQGRLQSWNYKRHLRSKQISHGGSPHGTLDPDLMRNEDPDPKTILPPHGLYPDPSCVLCCDCVTVHRSVMRVVYVPCVAHVRPHWIRIRDPDPVNLVSVPVWRAHWCRWLAWGVHQWTDMGVSLKKEGVVVLANLEDKRGTDIIWRLARVLSYSKEDTRN